MNPLVFDIYKMSAHDGPGMRTVVFLKGCPLRCRWCHNPESFRAAPEIWVYPERCIGCGQCMQVCPEGALSFDEKRQPVLNRDLCTGCGLCTAVCPSKTLLDIGKSYSLEELMKIIRREKPFMDATGGGVTFSGGEALLYPDYLKEALKACKDEGLHTAVDTSGSVPWESFEKVIPLTDLFLYDLKIQDPEKHREFTGQSNERILANLERLNPILEKNGKTLWIRTPLIPGASDSPDNIRETADYISTNLRPLPQKWELCAFNPLGEDKYKRLNLPWEYESGLMLETAQADSLLKMAKEIFADLKDTGSEDIVTLTGLTSS